MHFGQQHLMSAMPEAERSKISILAMLQAKRQIAVRIHQRTVPGDMVSTLLIKLFKCCQHEFGNIKPFLPAGISESM
jgi:hypothetical protein